MYLLQFAILAYKTIRKLSLYVNRSMSTKTSVVHTIQGLTKRFTIFELRNNAPIFLYLGVRLQIMHRWYFITKSFLSFTNFSSIFELFLSAKTGHLRGRRYTRGLILDGFLSRTPVVLLDGTHNRSLISVVQR